jgi:hypothetical protein
MRTSPEAGRGRSGGRKAKGRGMVNANNLKSKKTCDLRMGMELIHILTRLIISDEMVIDSEIL